MAKIVEYKLKKQVWPDIDADVAAGLLGLQQPQPAPTNALVGAEYVVQQLQSHDNNSGSGSIEVECH